MRVCAEDPVMSGLRSNGYHRHQIRLKYTRLHGENQTKYEG